MATGQAPLSAPPGGEDWREPGNTWIRLFLSIVTLGWPQVQTIRDDGLRLAGTLSLAGVQLGFLSLIAWTARLLSRGQDALAPWLPAAAVGIVAVCVVAGIAAGFYHSLKNVEVRRGVVRLIQDSDADKLAHRVMLKLEVVKGPISDPGGLKPAKRKLMLEILNNCQHDLQDVVNNLNILTREPAGESRAR
jgi:hypothetical protein